MYGLAARVGAHFGGRADLSLPACGRRRDSTTAASSPRTMSPFRSTIAEGKGPSDHHAAAARLVEARKRRTMRPWSCRFAEKRARDVPLFVAALPIFSRAYYADQAVRRIDARYCRSARALQGRALRSRPLYRIRAGEGLVGRGLPVSRGQYNFDMVRFEYYRDRDVAFEGFTGKNYLFREEFTSRIWATRYDFPAINDGRVKRDILPDDTPSGAQGWFINTRREQVQGPAAARGADLRLRLRVDQQDHHVRLLQAHPFGVPELRHDGDGQAVRGGACAARAVPRQGAGGSVRRTVRAAGVRRFGPGPRRCCARRCSCCRRPAIRSRTASGVLPNGERFTIEFLIEEPSSSRTICPSSRISARSASMPPCASSIRRSIAARRRRFRFRYRDPALQLLGDAGRFAAHLSSPRRRPTTKARKISPASPIPVIDALIDPIIAAENRADADHRLPGARPRDPRRPLLDSALVQSLALGRLLGCVRPPAAEAAICRGVLETWWYDRDKAANGARG